MRGLLLAGLGLFALASTGCSSADDPTPPMLAGADPAVMVAPSAHEACANHEEGCPCDTPGDLIDCGRVKRVAGDYVWCGTGMQTCGDDGSWGKCTGDGLVAAPNQ